MVDRQPLLSSAGLHRVYKVQAELATSFTQRTSSCHHFKNMSGRGNISWYSSSSGVNGSSNNSDSANNNNGGNGGWHPFAPNKKPIQFGNTSARKPTAAVTPFEMTCNICCGTFSQQQDYQAHFDGDC